MENYHRFSEQTSIGIGPMGGGGGKRFIYKPKSFIKQIIIRHAGVIDSLVFICQEGKHSPRFGGNGGEKTSKVNIDCPSEYLTGITGTIGSYSGYRVIASLTLHTNVTMYGPFGQKCGNSFTLPVEDGFIVGFHGRFGSCLDAIGYYVRPLGTNHLPLSNLSKDTTKVLVPRNPIPFGGLHQSYGNEFDDGVFNGIEQIIVHSDSHVNTLQGIRIQYVSGRDECGLVWSQRHGAHSSSLHKIQFDFPDEFLIGISGYYGPVQSDVWSDVIRSITFLTNKDVYGPFGSEVGTFFSSQAEGGKIAGFYGRAGTYLYSIGVHMKYM